MAYMSESGKVRDMENLMKFIKGKIADVGCGPDKITPDAIGYDGKKLDGVNVDGEGCWINKDEVYDTVFSSHFLEHTANPFDYMIDWYGALKPGGHLVLYLPDQRWYDNNNNPEHLHSWNYRDFMFWFVRALCGGALDFKGQQLERMFELVISGEDKGDDRYSFWLVAKKV